MDRIFGVILCWNGEVNDISQLPPPASLPQLWINSPDQLLPLIRLHCQMNWCILNGKGKRRGRASMKREKLWGGGGGGWSFDRNDKKKNRKHPSWESNLEFLANAADGLPLELLEQLMVPFCCFNVKRSIQPWTHSSGPSWWSQTQWTNAFTIHQQQMQQTLPL